ncbi:MAG: type II toxin-antitoxin system VapC family toxin [Waterburya sp.]
MIEQYLLDTCVISEYIRKKPEMKVIRWVDLQPEENLFISVITLGEIKKGIVKIEFSQPKKHQKLNKWLQNLIQRFDRRILALDSEILIEWGNICGKVEQSAKKLPVIDSLLAATAITNQLTLVTRNEDDFYNINLPLYNPWNS